MARNVETPETEAAVPAEAGKKKNQQVNATISGELFDLLDDYRWEIRVDRMPKLVAIALQEYAENHGLTASK